MITEPNEFMQRLQELQDSSSVTYSTLPSNEPRFIIDANSRTINIPPEFQFLGVKNDHKAETVYFEIDRYFDDEDLSTHTCVVQFENKSGEGGIYPVTIMDTESIDGKIIFGWEILSDATTIVGDIIFSVRFYSLDNYVFTYNFNTLPAKSIILDTLNVDDPTVVENYPSELEAWLDRMNDLSQNVVKPEDVELLDTKMDTLETSFGELETNVNSSVDGLKGDLDDVKSDFVKDIVPLYINVIKNSCVNSTGIHEYEGWSRTNYIELEKYKYGTNCLRFDTLSRYTRNCVFFDENNSIVSAFSVDTSTEKGLVHIPINAHKMIVSAEDEALKTIALTNPKKINGFEIDEYKQITSIIGDEIYPNINYTNKGYISNSNGEVISYEDWSYTDYIDVHNAKSLNFISTLEGNRSYNAIYTKGKKFIRGFDTSKPLDLSDVDGAYYVRLSNPTAYHFIVEKVFDNIVGIANSNKVPSYYNNYLKEKNKKVNEIMDNIKECTSFVFFTDVHVNNNSLNSPYIIKNILENTSVNDVICGGDIISGYNDENGIVKDCEIYLNKFGFSKPYFVRGNHDCYAKITEESTEGYIKDNKFVINRLMRKMPNDISIENGKTYYTFDRAQSKTRFIVIDTNENIHSTTDSGSWQTWYDISQEQINWFINELKNIPNGYKAIVCGHVPCVENIKWGSYFAYPFGDIIEAYNNKTTLNKHYDFGVNVDADFTNTSAKVCLYICGHGHTDDYYKSSSGCVYAELNCDAYLNNGGNQYMHEIGTITEQCVTVVMVNDDGYVQTVRYGVGIDQNYD